nr:MAG TPA: hypothetical protein [Caudoviricetes sp.]
MIKPIFERIIAIQSSPLLYIVYHIKRGLSSYNNIFLHIAQKNKNHK